MDTLFYSNYKKFIRQQNGCEYENAVWYELRLFNLKVELLKHFNCPLRYRKYCENS